jgi:hypothetical protein
MVLKSAFAVAVCTGLLISVSPVMADEYRANEFLGLDLSKAVLSPKRLGPDAEFAPVPIEAKADRAAARAEHTADRKTAIRATKGTSAYIERPRGAARVKLAKRHGNPLDAQARDTRIQTWPCRSGGICNWRRYRQQHRKIQINDTEIGWRRGAFGGKTCSVNPGAFRIHRSRKMHGMAY